MVWWGNNWSQPLSHHALQLDITQSPFVWPSATYSMANIQREHGVTAPGLGSFQKLDGGARGLRGLRLELAWGGLARLQRAGMRICLQMNLAWMLFLWSLGSVFLVISFLAITDLSDTWSVTFECLIGQMRERLSVKQENRGHHTALI